MPQRTIRSVVNSAKRYLNIPRNARRLEQFFGGFKQGVGIAREGARRVAGVVPQVKEGLKIAEPGLKLLETLGSVGLSLYKKAGSL